MPNDSADTTSPAPVAAEPAPSEQQPAATGVQGHRPPEAAGVGEERDRAAAARAAAVVAREKAAPPKEKTAEQRAKEAERQKQVRLARKLDKLKGDREAYAAELRRQLQEEFKEEGGGAGPRPSTGSQPTPPAEAPGAAPTQNANAVVLSPDKPAERTFKVAAGRPGWPSDQDVEEWRVLAELGVGGLAVAARGTRFEAAFTPEAQKKMAQAIAAVAAKRLPGGVDTPEADLALVLSLSFGPALAGLAKDTIIALRARRAAR